MNRKGNRFGPYCELPEIPVIATGTLFLILNSSTIDMSPKFSAVFHEQAFLGKLDLLFYGLTFTKVQ